MNAIAYCLTFTLCCFLVCLAAIGVAFIESEGKKECVRIECKAQATSIREQLQMQIGSMLQTDPESGTNVFPPPFMPNNHSAE
jgi:hypothetical protein